MSAPGRALAPFRRAVLNGGTAPGGPAAPETAERLVASLLRAVSSGADLAGIRGSTAYAEAGAHAAALRELDLRSLVGPLDRLAFWVNVYNALALHGPVALGLRRSVWEVWNYFGRVSYEVGGVALSLDEIEHGILRGNRARVLPPWRPFRRGDARRRLACAPMDPRVHFALNCGARACPPVRVYRAASLDAQLDLAARSFVNQEVVLTTDGRIACSRIFRWYRGDFVRAGGLRSFLVRHLDDGPVREALAAGQRPCQVFRPYSWALAHPPAEP